MLGIITSRMATSGWADSIKRERRVAIAGLHDVVALEAEGPGQGLADGPIIVGDQYSGAHTWTF